LTPAAKDFLSNGPAPGLFYDGVDRSADYNRCLDESGYDEDAVMAYLIDLETQSQNNTRQMRANNQWADCARDNGFPNIADTSLDVLGAFIGTGAVELPVSMTTEQLKQLLQACPLVDWSMRDRLNDWLFAQDWKVDTADYPDWYIPDPMIGFDWSALPEARDPDWLAGPAGGAMADHAAELAEIVKAAQSR
jgi:hypothetical protein